MKLNHGAIILMFALTAMSARAFAADDAATSSSTTTTTTSSSSSSDSLVTNATSDYTVRLQTEETRFNLGFYGNVSTFSLQGKSLLGNAVEVQAIYAIKNNLAACVSIGQALSIQGGLSVAYTNLRAAFQHAWWGDFIHSKSVVMVNGQRSVETKSGAGSLLASDVGVEQLLFNGTQRVIPGTGVSAGVRYDKTFGSFRASAIGRYGMIAVSSETSSMMTVGAGIIYSF